MTISNDGRRSLMVASLRYLDAFVKVDGAAWLFSERRLYVPRCTRVGYSGVEYGMARTVDAW